MSQIFIILYKISKRLLMLVYSIFCSFYSWIKLKGNGVKFSTIYIKGIPMIDVEMGGKLIIGKNFHINNGRYYNKIGRQQPSIFFVSKGGCLSFGENVGVSGSTFVCTKKITIGSNVKIGGNCVFYDTDFHSLNFLNRRDTLKDIQMTKSKPIIIEDDVFIGAHSTILKGVTIGARSVIGACSLVSKSIPPNEIWGGNPISFIKSL